jgi:soluble cytochrome b562
MSIYNELLNRIWRAYRDAGNGFHPADAQAKIATAFEAFETPFRNLADQIERQRAGLYPSRDAFLADAGNTLRLIDADLDVLKAAVAAAARADNMKVSRVIVDQAIAARKAKEQQRADADMVKQVEGVIAQARENVKSAAG